MRAANFTSLFLCFAAFLWLTGCVTTNTDTAQSESEKNQLSAQEIVSRSRTSVEAIVNSPDFTGVRGLLAQAKGVMVFPKLVKGAFLVGGEGGTGIVLVRQADGSWGYPAFYNMVGGSFGLQIGVESAETLFLIMTQKGLDSVLKNQFKLGADVSIALGPIGAGLGAAKTAPDLASDVYVYAKASGLFGGGAFKGAIISKRDDLNNAYYLTETTPRQILTENQFNNGNADDLRAALSMEPILNNKAVPLTPVHQY